MDRATIAELVAKYRKKIELYQGMIAELEGEMGSHAGPLSGDSSNPSAQTGRRDEQDHKKANPGDPTSLVRDWQFFNKSQPEAAEDLLNMLNHPLSTDEIVNCLEKGGLKLGGTTAKDKKQNLYTILARSGRFGRAAKNTWGLPGWPGVTLVKMKRGDEKESSESEQPDNATAA